MKKRHANVIAPLTAMILIAPVVVACAQTVVTPSVDAIQTAIAQTLSAQPTNTLPPSATPPPPPTVTPEPVPIHLSGSGDDVIDLERPANAALVHISGNAAGGHLLAVTAYGANEELIDLLVNTNDPYEGVRPLDFYQDQHTTRLEVKATGEWTIDITNLNEGQRFEVPGEIIGSGDEVLILAGKPPDVATIEGNEAAKEFSVISFAPTVKQLVKTTQPYNGKVLLDPQAKILVIKAQGPWKINITTK
jgi:hypothetical protein